MANLVFKKSHAVGFLYFWGVLIYLQYAYATPSTDLNLVMNVICSLLYTVLFLCLWPLSTRCIHATQKLRDDKGIWALAFKKSVEYVLPIGHTLLTTAFKNALVNWAAKTTYLFLLVLSKVFFDNDDLTICRGFTTEVLRSIAFHIVLGLWMGKPDFDANKWEYGYLTLCLGISCFSVRLPKFGPPRRPPTPCYMGLDTMDRVYFLQRRPQLRQIKEAAAKRTSTDN